MGQISFTPMIWVDKLDPDPNTRPWWLCVPKDPPEPCPVRPTTFVDFADYDLDFKFPLQSSRKPSKIIRPSDCVVCAPTLIGQVEPEPPPPPPECEFPSPWQIEINNDMYARITYRGTLLTSSNYDDYLPSNMLIATTGNEGDGSADTEYRFVFNEDDADGYNFDTTQSSGLPFPDCLNIFLEHAEGYSNYVGLANCCDEPPPVCASMEVTPYSPTVFQTGVMLNAPDWFVYGDTPAFVVAFEDDWDNYFTFTWDGNSEYVADGTLPFGSFGGVLDMMIAVPIVDAPVNFDWSCIAIRSYIQA